MYIDWGWDYKYATPRDLHSLWLALDFTDFQQNLSNDVQFDSMNKPHHIPYIDRWLLNQQETLITLKVSPPLSGKHVASPLSCTEGIVSPSPPHRPPSSFVVKYWATQSRPRVQTHWDIAVRLIWNNPRLFLARPFHAYIISVTIN